MRNVLRLAVLALLIPLAAGCKAPITLSIDEVGYTINNTAADYWLDGTGPALSYNFYVYLSGDFDVVDIDYARIYLPNSSTQAYWSFKPLQDYDPYYRSISGLGFSYDGAPNLLPIGVLKAEIGLTDGTKRSLDFTMGVPGTSVLSSQYTWVFSPEATSGVIDLTKAAPALSRGTVTALGQDSATATVSFTVNGSNVNNGYLWFYDSADNYLGRSPRFRPNEVQTYSGMPGGFSAADGAANSVTIPAADILDANGAPLSSTAAIAACRLVLLDGAQYDATNFGSYDYRSISARYPAP